MSRLPQFDRRRLRIRPLDERNHDVPYSSLMALDEPPLPLEPAALRDLKTLGERLVAARDAVLRR